MEQVVDNMGSPNVASGNGLSKAGAFERFIVAKTTNSSDTTTSGSSNTHAGDMTFLVDNPRGFSSRGLHQRQ